ncbi:MAG TPA: V-type ATP synthase subunit A, partial [Spirochaetota bacterium]|nr:V-type ATP synthase subunit A [Spirochaetota bacterium]
VSIIGAVSPPGGDFSEPVTQHTTRFIRCFWALDKTLADARHYPSIGWIESYSEYLGDMENWWNGKNEEWSEMRKELMNVLLEDNRLQQIVKLVGPDALPAGQRFTLFCAEMIRNAFLQQNAFDANDMYCSPGKQISLLRIIRIFMHQGRELLNLGADLSIITSMEEASEILRLKSEYPNEDAAGLSRYAEELTSAMVKIRGSLEMH